MGRWLDDELAAVGRQMRSGALDRARCLGPMLAIDDDGVHALWDRNSLIPFDPENGPYKARSEEHTSELQSLMRISYAVFCLKKKKTHKTTEIEKPHTIDMIKTQTTLTYHNPHRHI